VRGASLVQSRAMGGLEEHIRGEKDIVLDSLGHGQQPGGVDRWTPRKA
jgi:hypothetical protein